MRERPAEPLRLLFLAVLPFLLYLPCLPGEFVIDDHRFIVENGANLQRLSTPWVYFADPSTNADRHDQDIYRPLRTLSFALDRAWFGIEPRGYHLHSILLHAAVAVLAYVLLRRSVPPDVAFLGVLLFCVHPLATEAVAWISSRADLQAALLTLLALIVARRAESGGPGNLVFAGLLAFLAGFGKETAVVLPALYLVERRLRTGRFLAGGIAPLVALAMGTTAYLAVYLNVTGRGITGQVGWYEGSWLTHLPYALVGLATSLRLAFLPVGQNPLWETNLFQPLSPLDVGRAVAGLCLFVAVLVVCRRRAPGVTYGGTFWGIAIVPAANLFLPLRTVLAERFAYLPLIGLCLAAAAAASHARPWLSRRHHALPIATSVIAIAGLSVLTAVRASAWRTAEGLYDVTIADHPGSYAARLGLGGLWIGRAERAGAVGPDLRDGLVEADRILGEAIEIAAGDPVRECDAAYARGRARVLLGEFPAAVAVLGPLETRLAADPDLRDRVRNAAEARFQLGLALSRFYRLDEAAAVFRRLMADHGETARRVDALAEVERALLDPDALKLYERALTLDPNYHPARVHLAAMLVQLGIDGEAKRQLREVLARDPGNAAAQKALAELDAAR